MKKGSGRRTAQVYAGGYSHLELKLTLAGALLIACFLTGFSWAVDSTQTVCPVENVRNQKVVYSAQISLPVENGVAAGTDDWNLILVNPWNPIPSDYTMTRTSLKNGHSVDERCYSDLQQMMDDCRAAGLSPVICSSYRSMEKQESLYQKQVDRLVGQGYSLEQARVEAGKAVAAPGTSEHQLGLAVDIVDRENQRLDESQEQTAVQRWLMKNSWQYGFILRYPNQKSEITGIIYEPWHYRYVGRQAAQEIYRQNICLEEYLQQLSQ